MLTLLFLLPAASLVCGSIDEGLMDAADGEIAMKNLEAAQVKMEQKLSSLTSFIDQELEKAQDSPVSSMSKGYVRRKREAEQPNPLLALPQNTVKEMVISMKALNTAFDNLQKAYEDYKHTKDLETPGAGPEDVQEPEDGQEPEDEITPEGEMDPEGEMYPEAEPESENYPEDIVPEGDGGELPENVTDDYPIDQVNDEYPDGAPQAPDYEELPEGEGGEEPMDGADEDLNEGDDVVEVGEPDIVDESAVDGMGGEGEVDAEGEGEEPGMEEDNMDNQPMGKGKRGKGKGKGKGRGKGKGKGKRGKGKGKGRGRRF